ncbi:hypothetical protein RvY_09173 [Ramazzottius varieornatus]|uniref:Uncharacterized protein n=1 Tax=Ramazzottius varieornatus TaxID=947166 RepID=A0A1D1VHJ3_RAMVA|nr:hypothetical protein RvY_09173 [Ramazzottius varieornatus]
MGILHLIYDGCLISLHFGTALVAEFGVLQFRSTRKKPNNRKFHDFVTFTIFVVPSSRWICFQDLSRVHAQNGSRPSVSYPSNLCRKATLKAAQSLSGSTRRSGERPTFISNSSVVARADCVRTPSACSTHYE